MATKLTKKQTKAVLADAKKLRARDKAKAAERGKKLTLSKNFKPTVPARTPPKDTSKRPSSRAYANNRNVIDSLVEPEKVAINNPSTMSGNRDSQRQAFNENKTGVSKNYKVVDGKMVEIDEAEWKKAAQKFVKQEGTGRGTIKKGQTVANAPKPSRADVIKGAVAKVQGKRGLGGDLSAAERKMAREGNAPARAPATPPTPKPAAPAPVAAPKVATTTTSKMTRAERSAANKAAHAVKRAAEEKKWAEQKAGKKGKAPKADAKPKATVAKPTAPAKTAPTPTAKKTTTAKPATPLPQAAKPAPKSWMARNLPNVSTVLKEGLTSKVGRQAAVSAGKNFVAGALSRGGVLVTGLTYSPDAGESYDSWKAAVDKQAAETRKLRREAAAKVSAAPAASTSTSKPATQTQTTKPAAPKKTTSQAPKKQTATKTATPVESKAQVAAPMTANPEKAIADFEAKLRAAGVVSVAGGASGKAQMVPQPMSVTQLEDQFKRKKGPR